MQEDRPIILAESSRAALAELLNTHRAVVSLAFFALLAGACPAWLEAGESKVADRTLETNISPENATRKIRDLLALLGVDEDQLARLTDGGPLDSTDEEPVWKLLYAARRLRRWDLKRYALGETSLAHSLSNPDAMRGVALHVTGHVVRVDRVRLPADTAQRLGFDQYYRCQWSIDKGPAKVVTDALEIPTAWSVGKTVDYRASAYGLFAKVLNGLDKEKTPLLVARRIAWHPPTILGNLGMDVGLFDKVEDRRDIRREERECFYQLLAACGRAEPGELARSTAAKQYSVVPLFNDPSRQRGKLWALSGTAVHAVLVRVEERDIQARFGIDHYYEVAMFTDDSQQNPVIFCVLELPQGMPSGDDIFETVRIAGFFFKAWAYPRASGDRKKKQIAPLLIGRSPQWSPPEQRSSLGWIAGVLFAAAILGLWLIIRYVGRRDEQAFGKRVAAKYRAAGPPSEPLDLRPPADDMPPS